MNPAFTTIDIIIVAAYLLIIVALGLWVSRKKNNKEKTAEDYFLASKSLPWWAIGASLIAANISAEQFIGMSGSGFAGGFAIASYEFMAALTILIVAKFFLPIFMKQGIYTIPEFVEKRYSMQLKTILAVFWIALFIFVNLTSVLFLGGKAIDTIVGTGDGSLIVPAIIVFAVIAACYSLYGGLSAVAWTDVLQVVLLVVGGIITTIVALHYVSPDGTIMQGVNHVADVASDRFDLILSKDNPEYQNLPGIMMLIGGSPLSTAGGIKVTTIFIIMTSIISYFSGKRLAPFKRVFSDTIISKSMTTVFLVVTIIMVAFVAIGFFGIVEIEGHTINPKLEEDLYGMYLFSVFSFFGNVGFYTGLEPFFSVGAKIVLCFLMLLGHLGPMTFFQLFQNNLDKKASVHYSFVEEDFLIG